MPLIGVATGVEVATSSQIKEMIKDWSSRRALKFLLLE